MVRTIGDEKKNLTPEMKKQQKTIVDILKNNTRFMIHSLLSIYPRMSLPTLKKFTGKSKSTLSVHLSKMIEAGIVEEADEVKVRGSIKKKYYKLTSTADETWSAVSPTRRVPRESASNIRDVDAQVLARLAHGSKSGRFASESRSVCRRSRIGESAPRRRRMECLLGGESHGTSLFPPDPPFPPL